MAISLQGQQGHRGGGQVVFRAPAVRVGAGQTPQPAAHILLLDQPFQSQLDRRLGGGRAAVGAQQRLLGSLFPPRQRQSDRRCQQLAARHQAVQAQVQFGRRGKRIEGLHQVFGQHRIGDVGHVQLGKILQELFVQLDALVFRVDRLDLHPVFLVACQVQHAQQDQGDHMDHAADQPRRRRADRLVCLFRRRLLGSAVGANPRHPAACGAGEDRSRQRLRCGWRQRYRPSPTPRLSHGHCRAGGKLRNLLVASRHCKTLLVAIRVPVIWWCLAGRIGHATSAGTASDSKHRELTDRRKSTSLISLRQGKKSVARKNFASPPSTFAAGPLEYCQH